jgi:hypothetical protein
MTFDPLRVGAVLTSEPAALGTGKMLAEKVFQFALLQLRLQFRRRRPVRRLSDSLDALLAAGKRSGKDVAVTLDRVPAGLDAAHVGFVFADVMGSDHCQVLLCATGLRPSRSDGGRPGSIAQAQIVVAGIVPADGTSAANCENGDFGGSRFYGQLFRQELLAL